MGNFIFEIEINLINFHWIEVFFCQPSSICVRKNITTNASEIRCSNSTFEFGPMIVSDMKVDFNLYLINKKRSAYKIDWFKM